MSTSVERLRVWLLAGAGLLVLVIAAFLGYAHWRAHRFLTDLPKKLGANIRRETNGFTYSQSVQGRTVYTIHAAKAVERADGKVTLHDVGIVLYGRQQNRADRIYGNEFEYDQAAGVVRAVGEVHIDLQAPEAADLDARMDYAAGNDLHDDSKGEEKDERLIHIKTSGLIFMQKLGIAATDNEIEFASGGMTGRAKGADYNSDSGVVVLHQDVRVNGLEHDRPVVLTASRAELDRPAQKVVLSQARYVSVDGSQASGAGETAEARHVVVHLRSDGTAERLEAEGDVTLTSGDNGQVTAPRGGMVLNEKNQPQSAFLSGGVKYAVDGPLRQAQGLAAEGKGSFDKTGRPEHISMTGAVRLHERVRVSEAAAWDERELQGNAVELALGSEASGKAQLHDAKASGKATISVVNAAKSSVVGATSSALAGDELTAHFIHMGGTDHISEVHGEGHTMLRKVDAKGTVNMSTADSLVAYFQPGGSQASSTATSAERQGRDAISSATQQGHVIMTQTSAKKPGDTAAPAEERATANRVLFDGILERTTLIGDVQLSDGTDELWADRVVTEQRSGNAVAEGAVKASYKQQADTQGPVHVLAARAQMKHDSQVALFFGAVDRPARLWQGASQVDAPVLQFERNKRRLVARGDGQGAPMAVHTVLVGTGNSAKAAESKPNLTTKKQSAETPKTQVIRVASRELVYTDESRQADFTGGVEVAASDGGFKAQRVVVYLQPAAPTHPGTPASVVGPEKMAAADTAGIAPGIGGGVERIVATGAIDMQQLGRRATGEQLVYTASDGIFVLTGTVKAPPKVVDAVRGTITGTSLRFHTGDDNVVVSNGEDSATGQRVRTETRVKNKK